MTSTELRIGNLVHYGHGREPQKITASDLHLGVEGRPFAPIEITKEWLFKNTVVACDGKDSEWYELSSNGYLKIKPLEGSFFFFFGKEEIVEVTTVHHLQNLYFSITGRELL